MDRRRLRVGERHAASCQTATEPVLAASAALRESERREPRRRRRAAVAGAFFHMRESFQVHVPGSEGRGRDVRFSEDVPETVLVADEVGLREREVVLRRRRDPEAGEQERIRDVEVLCRAEQARTCRVLSGSLERRDHRVRGHHPVDVGDRLRILVPEVLLHDLQVELHARRALLRRVRRVVQERGRRRADARVGARVQVHDLHHRGIDRHRGHVLERLPAELPGGHERLDRLLRQREDHERVGARCLERLTCVSPMRR